MNKKQDNTISKEEKAKVKAEKKEVSAVKKQARLAKKPVTDKKANKNELKTLASQQKSELDTTLSEITVLKTNYKEIQGDEKTAIKNKIAELKKEVKDLKKTQKKELKKRKKELKHKYKIASKETKQKIKSLKKDHKSKINKKLEQIKKLKASLKGKTPEQKVEVKALIVTEKKELKLTKKDQKLVIKKQKKQLKRLKEKMKRSKARVRYIPLIIVLVLLLSVYIFLAFFLDGFVKNIVIDVVETAAEAKCEIEVFDIEILDSYLLIEGFSIANKNNTMENLVEFERMILDFDLTELLLARIVAEEISLEGVVVFADRETDGALPPEQLAAIIKEKEEKKAQEEAEGPSEFEQAMDKFTEDVGSNSQNFIEDLIEAFTFDNIVESYLAQLTIPGVVEDAEVTITEIVEYWQKTIPELESTGARIAKATQELIAIYQSPDVSAQVIKEGLETTAKLLKESQVMYDQIEELLGNIDEDANEIQNLIIAIDTSIKSDTAFIKNEINKITSFDASAAEGLITEFVEAFVVSALGEYYPMVLETIAYLESLKVEEPTTMVMQKEKREFFHRLEGQTIAFTKAMPQLLIEEVKFSGSDAGEWLAVDGFINNITHQPDIIDKPAEGKLNITIDKYDIGLDVLVDMRSETENDLLELVAVGDGIGTKFLQQSTQVGVPSIDGVMGIDTTVNVTQQGDFMLGAKVIIDNALITSDPFEPAAIYDIYSDILGAIDSLWLNLDVGFVQDKGIVLKITTDADDKILQGMEVAVNNILSDIKISIQEDIQGYMAKYTKRFDNQLSRFDQAREDLARVSSDLGNSQRSLRNSQSSFENTLKSDLEQLQKEAEAAAQKAIDEAKAKKEAEDAAKKAEVEAALKKAKEDADARAEERKEDAEEAIGNALGNLFGTSKDSNEE